MKVGLQINSFTWDGGTREIGPTLAEAARLADEVGFDSIWVMDHFFQIRGNGPSEDPMLEGLSALAFMAAHTRSVRLGLMVGGIHYRRPGLWAKSVTTLDVLSGGRAWLGLGAAWNEEESSALGFPMPPLRERFEMLEETIQLCLGMWEGERGSQGRLDGKHVTATRLLNSPQSLSRPRPPIMIGGGGEQRTLRLVARYGDACNILRATPETLVHKYEVLREHCERIGRPYEEIERSALGRVDLAREEPAEVAERFRALEAAGVQHMIFSVRGADYLSRLERVGNELLPLLRD
jgi:F420-dependent oxidoreductase-like protein